MQHPHNLFAAPISVPGATYWSFICVNIPNVFGVFSLLVLRCFSVDVRVPCRRVKNLNGWGGLCGMPVPLVGVGAAEAALQKIVGAGATFYNKCLMAPLRGWDLHSGALNLRYGPCSQC